MMNDALECYLVLKDARITGEYLQLDPEEFPLQAQIAQRDGQTALIVKQGSENIFTIWFREIEESFQCYQYHRIGHFWVEGQEHWRQLVYMTGTIYDKYEYMKEKACSDLEMELMHLIEFPPSLLVAGGGIPGRQISLKSQGGGMYEKVCQRSRGWDVRFFDRNL